MDSDDGITNDPTVQDQFRGKVRQIREDNNLTSNRQMQRNIANATYDINGQADELLAISGPEKGGFTDGPTVGNSHFQPPGYRDNSGTMDSEYKVLEKIADDYWSNDPAERARVTGEIRLYTELKPCLSCRDVIQQFKEAFPNLEIYVGWTYADTGQKMMEYRSGLSG